MRVMIPMIALLMAATPAIAGDHESHSSASSSSGSSARPVSEHVVVTQHVTANDHVTVVTEHATVVSPGQGPAVSVHSNTVSVGGSAATVSPGGISITTPDASVAGAAGAGNPSATAFGTSSGTTSATASATTAAIAANDGSGPLGAAVAIGIGNISNGADASP